MATIRTLFRDFGGILCSRTIPITKRLVSENTWNKCISRCYARGYDSDGKTVGYVVNKPSGSTLFIDDMFTDGFMLSSGVEVVGSLILFPHSIFSWHVLRAEDVNEDSLILFKILEPKVDLLIFGYGNKEAYTPQVRKQFTEACRKLGLRFEALPTDQAIGLFNFMSEERRFAAAALIPPIEIDIHGFEEPKPDLIGDDDDETETILKGIPSGEEKKYLK